MRKSVKIKMNGISSKNNLQEYLQKNKLPLPVYKTIQNNNKLWVCYLELFSEVYISQPFPNKNLAEKDSANLALLDLKNKKTYTELYLTDKTVIFVDLENRQTDIIDFVNNVKSKNISIIGLISEDHVLLEKINTIEEYKDDRVTIKIVPSSRKDGSDIGLSFMLGSFIISHCEYKNYIIISGDHFAKVLEECINRDFLDLGREMCRGYSFVNINSAISFLKTI